MWGVKFDTVICGLSYSMCGIERSKLRTRAIDYSWHGLDLYYNYLSLLEKYDYKYVLMVFPYYYLNYDMSLSEYQFETGQIYACRGFLDWHNAEKSESKVIYDHLVCNKLFGKKYWQYANWKKEYPVNKHVVSNEKVGLTNIWKNINIQTYQENIKILENLVALLAGTKMYIIVPPMYKNGIRDVDLHYIQCMKENFYRGLSMIKGEFKLYDFSEEFEESSLFYDYGHLNEEGRLRFTEIINKRVLNG